MKQIKTAGNDLIIVEVPEDAYDFTIYDNGVYFKPTLVQFNEYGEVNPHQSVNFKTYNLKSKILCKLSELSEEECCRFINKLYINYDTIKPIAWGFENYIKAVHGIQKCCNTAKESLISLLQSNGIDTDKNLLIIEVL